MHDAKTILVVDDVPMFRELAKVFLARTAHVVTADSGEEALELVGKRQVDLVVADLHMPGIGGAGLCETLKSDPKTCDLPVVVMLRGDAPGDSMLAVRAGADDMLCKPLAREGLIGIVNHFLEAGLARGLPRVDVSTPIRMRNTIVQSWGTTRNISRGGLLVDTDCEFTPKTELELDFVLPVGGQTMKPLAQVVWSGDPEIDGMRSIGLRFLSIDAATMRGLDDFLVHHAPFGIDPIGPSIGGHS